MDWSKAKTILITIFLLLNIYFAANIGVYTFGNTVSADTISNAITIIENRGVTIEHELDIPRSTKKTPMLMFELPEYDYDNILAYLLGEGNYKKQKMVDSTYYTKGDKSIIFKNDGVIEFFNDLVDEKTMIDMKDIKKAEKSLKDFIEAAGLNFSDYYLDWHNYLDSETLEIIFTQKYKDFYVYDNSVYFVIENGNIKYMRYSFKEIKGFTGQSTEILPAHVILLRNITREENARIIDIDLGFKGYVQSDFGTMVKSKSQSPVWRVVMRDNMGNLIFRHFSAYDSEEMESR